jgi:dTDP-D-glucose 4,6-dehydratase
MQETMRDLVDLLQKQCQPTINQLTELLADWYKMAQTTYLQTEILHKDIVNYQNSMETFSLMLKDSEEKYSTTMSEALGTINEHQSEQKRKQERGRVEPNSNYNSSSNGTTAQTPAAVNGNSVVANPVQRSGESKQVRKALRSILVLQDEVWGILHENSKLIEHFTHLAVTSPSSLDANSQQILADLEAAVLQNNC